MCGALLALGAAACTPSEPAPAVPASSITIGMPEVSVDRGGLQQAAMLSLEGLTQLGPDGRVLPRLAESWHWEADGHALRLTLRPGVWLHDGTPLTAGLAADLLRLAIAEFADLGLYPSLVDVSHVRPDGERDIVVELLRPSAFLPEDLSVRLVREDGVTGTGPYRLVGRTDSELALERFDQYYLGQPAIERVRIRPFETLRHAWTSLLRGEVDMVTDVPPDSLEFIRSNAVQVVSFPRWYQFLIAFDSSKPPFTSPAVRRALNLAIDRHHLIASALHHHATPAHGPLWPQHWAYDAAASSLSFDRQMAVSLLESAGLTRGAAAGVSPMRQARLRFTCLLPEGFSLLERIALEVQRQLSALDVDMHIEVLPFAEYDERVRAGDMEAVLIELISGPSLSRPYIFWRSAASSTGLNNFGYENPEAERLFTTLRTTTGEASVRSTTTRLQRVFAEDPPALFLAWSQRARVVRREFTVHQEPGRDPISSLWQWTPASEDVRQP